MVISDKNKYIFIAVPKTGTTSVTEYLLKHDSSAVRNRIEVNGKSCRVSEHATANEIKKLLGSKYSEYTCFAFVRNPYSKIVSSYYFYKEGRAAKKVQGGLHKWPVRLRVWFAKLMPFPIWAIVYPYHASCKYLIDSNKKLIVNNVGYFERLEEDFNRIFKNIGMAESDVKLPKFNQSNHDDYKSYIGDGFLRIILSMKVGRDFKLFYPSLKTTGMV